MNTEPTSKQIIAAAVAAAGGVSKAAADIGVRSPSVSAWLKRGSVPACRINRLCELGAFTITPERILDAMARRQYDSGKRIDVCSRTKHLPLYTSAQKVAA